MTEAKVSKYLLTILIILTMVMFVWTLNTLSNVNQVKIPTQISAFSA